MGPIGAPVGGGVASSPSGGSNQSFLLLVHQLLPRSQLENRFDAPQTLRGATFLTTVHMNLKHVDRNFERRKTVEQHIILDNLQ